MMKLSPGIFRVLDKRPRLPQSLDLTFYVQYIMRTVKGGRKKAVLAINAVSRVKQTRCDECTEGCMR